jgi:hypothetical protein
MMSFSALGAFFYSFLSKFILSECLLDTSGPTFYVIKDDEFVKSRIHQVFGVWYEIDDAISACSNTKH